MSEILKNAQQKQTELQNQINSSEEIKSQRPLFHFATPGGWCNDPNGFSQFGNKVHLFYQYHPYSTQWGPMHWGHVTSTDMLEWKLEPVALAPDSAADCKGCFSGTAIDDEGKHLLVYTGVFGEGDDYFQKQCIAIGDGVTYTKLSENPVVSADNIPFSFKSTDFRDPKIWKRNDNYYMACVLKQSNDLGALVLFESSDLKKWNYKGVLDSSKDGLSRMWECPDVFILDGKDMLILSPQEMKEDYSSGFHDGNNSVYITGVLDYEKCRFIRETRVENGYTAAQIDYGIDFYAPETTTLKDGRTIMIGWMQSWESYITPENYIWSGMMTIPRELSYKNNRLYQVPVRELEKWKNELQQGQVSSGNTETLASGIERHFEVYLEVPADGNGEIVLLTGDTAGKKVLLGVNSSEGFISFDRRETLTPGSISTRKAKLEPEGDKIALKILCDTCSLEVFVDDGKMAFTNTFFLDNTRSSVQIINKTDKSVEYKIYKINQRNK